MLPTDIGNPWGAFLNPIYIYLRRVESDAEVERQVGNIFKTFAVG